MDRRSQASRRPRRSAARTWSCWLPAGPEPAPVVRWRDARVPVERAAQGLPGPEATSPGHGLDWLVTGGEGTLRGLDPDALHVGGWRQAELGGEAALQMPRA